MYLPFLVALVLLSCWYAFKIKRNQYKLPPGPRGLPLFGNFHQVIVKNPFDKLSQWADKYGKIYTIDLCTKPAVVINDPNLIRDILNTFPATGKFQTESSLLISQGQYGVLNTEGELWVELRAFCLKKLKEFGFGNKRMETLILSEANEVCDWITNQNLKNDGKPLIMLPIFLQSMVNTAWTMVAGTRISLGDSKIAQLLDTWFAALQYTMKTGLIFLTSLKYVAPQLSGYTAFSNACLDVTRHIEKEFINHKKTFIAGAQRDLIDAYIEQSENDPLKWKHSIATVVELFVASAETTGSTLVWLLFYLSTNPDIQKNMQKEIDTVVGENEEIFLDHKPRMPYTEAVILETLRLSCLLPVGVMHRLLDDLEIDKYKFPRGLILVANIYHCHYNKDVWTDPHVFRPERFLGSQGDYLKSHVIPFQPGKRQCIGEPLAKDILFIFVTRIFQLFDVLADKHIQPEDYYKPGMGFFRSPPKLGVVFKLRAK